jgi:hypothetical protein
MNTKGEACDEFGRLLRRRGALGGWKHKPWAWRSLQQSRCASRPATVNEMADADADVAVLAKRLRVSNLSGKGDDRSAVTGPSAGASISAHAAGGEGVGVEGAVGQRTWSIIWASWWNWSDSAWNEIIVHVEANRSRPCTQLLWGTLRWWGTDQSKRAYCQGWRLNPYYQPAEVAAEQSL